MVPIGTTHLWLLRGRTHHSSASVHLPLLVGARSGIVAAFCLHTIRVKPLAQVVESLLQKGAFELAPLSSLGYYSRLFFIMKALGSWRPVLNLSLLYLIVRRIHHPEGSVSAISDASVFQIVSSVHGVRQSLPFSAVCFGLSAAPQVFTQVMAPVRSFSPQSLIRLRPYLHDWLIQTSSRE